MQQKRNLQKCGKKISKEKEPDNQKEADIPKRTNIKINVRLWASTNQKSHQNAS
jgi:hypothetical protein